MKISFLLMMLSLSGAAIAQNGIGTTSPNPAAALDVSAANKGFLPPRIALTAANVWGLAGTPTDGMMIYNTAYAGTSPNVLAPGLYYWKGLQWFAVSQPVSASPYNANATINCAAVGGPLSPVTSTFVNGQSYTGTITAPYQNGNGGAYPTDVVTINGITLTRQAGILASTLSFPNGAGNILYTVSGTWNGGAATGTFPLNLPANICSVTLPMAPATVNSFYAYPAGTFQEDVPMTTANAAFAIVTAGSSGTYTASSNTLNGVTFSGSGALVQGAGDTVLLAATGTPAGFGTFNYTITINGHTAAMSVTFTPELITACTSISQGAPSSTLVNGSTYIGYLQWSYTNGNGLTSVPAQTIGPISGLTLSRPATAISAGNGIVTYTIYGTYSGVTGGTVSFPISLDGNNCTVVYGDAIRRAMFAAGCNSCSAYDAVSSGTWVQVTSLEYNSLQNTLTNLTVAGAPTTALTANIYNTLNNTNLTATTSTPTNVKIPGGSYIVGFAVNNAGNVSYVATTRLGPKVKFSTTINNNFSNYGSSLPDETLSSYPGTTSWFILKAPAAIASPLSTYLGYFDGGGPAPIDDYDAGYTSQKGTGNTGTLATSSALWWRIQAVTTTVKQW